MFIIKYVIPATSKLVIRTRTTECVCVCFLCVLFLERELLKEWEREGVGLGIKF